MKFNNDTLNIYICGPTVYDDIHVGNLRAVIIFDAIFEYSRKNGTKLYFLHNITDIDDKIIDKSLELGISESELAEKYTEEYFKILKIFNIRQSMKFVSVTKKLEQIIKYISLLQKKGFTYYNENNDLVFDTAKIDNYGVISGQKKDELVQKNNKEIKSNNDFVLWKNTKKGIFFASPFGFGRPGWHTECAAIIYDYFGEKSIDIHSGGVDLVFPHHENENAQHLALTGNPISKKWLRAGVVNLNGKKMAKSLQNVMLAKDFAEKYEPDVLRSIFLSINPTTPINLTDELILNHKKLIEKYKKVFFDMHFDSKPSNDEKMKQVLELFEEGKFTKANFLISELIKQKENLTLKHIFSNLGFNFINKSLGDKNWKKIEEWKGLNKEGKLEEANKIRDELWKIYQNL
ncbi:Cysteine--tRNA ligase [Mesomycoplasma dispar]|uniref:Cysteine--tRNA ligase n=1 Tax=Mesomycoplasma dispar TaxID=86660 RepID=A0AAJ5TCY6_9BACT|nr:class I tRNA ligase family protein [Mesomycoplasma dispar]AJR12476.1 cysteinyl-tRNA synthetase [Mesomycoplasma dispar]VEU62700.1 Cysteine--tRNA ligase [Mesomycoplasma dispar]